MPRPLLAALAVALTLLAICRVLRPAAVLPEGDALGAC